MSRLQFYCFVSSIAGDTMPIWTDSHGFINLFIETEDAKSCSHSGECFSDVLALSKSLYIQKQLAGIRPLTIAKVLKEYGAWTPQELRSKRENIIRLLWIATNDIAKKERTDATEKQ